MEGINNTVENNIESELKNSIVWYEDQIFNGQKWIDSFSTGESFKNNAELIKFEKQFSVNKEIIEVYKDALNKAKQELEGLKSKENN